MKAKIDFVLNVIKFALFILFVSYINAYHNYCFMTSLVQTFFSRVQKNQPILIQISNKVVIVIAMDPEYFFKHK